MSDWITVARIARPRGLRGEVVADGITDNPERLLTYQNLTLSSTGESVELEGVRVHDGRFFLKLKGIDSVESAERLRNTEIRISRDDLPEPEDGEMYYSDLLDCVVWNIKSGAQLGLVTDCKEYGGQVTLEVLRPDREPVLIPFVPAICVRVDLEGKRIDADLPEGLEDLDRP